MIRTNVTFTALLLVAAGAACGGGGGGMTNPTPGPATHLVFTVQPADADTGSPVAPTVRVAVKDADGLTVTASVFPVTLVLANNPSNATLSGGGPINTSNGIASFPGLSVNSVGTGYTLTASSGALQTATSVGFDVALPPPTPTTIAVTVGTGILFRSVRNNTSNPAVDTLAVGGTVTWSHMGGSHNVRSTGSPSFTSSFGAGPANTVMNATYQFQFNTVGTYQYNCGIHGAAMSGRVVVK